jgi:hypothetical protein
MQAGMFVFDTMACSDEYVSEISAAIDPENCEPIIATVALLFTVAAPTTEPRVFVIATFPNRFRIALPLRRTAFMI